LDQNREFAVVTVEKFLLSVTLKTSVETVPLGSLLLSLNSAIDLPLIEWEQCSVHGVGPGKWFSIPGLISLL